MPGKRRRFNVRFTPGRVKKMMQKNPDVGKMAMAVPVLISKILEMFATSLVEKAKRVTQSRNSRTLSVHHVKQCIESEGIFEFLKGTVERALAISAAKENQKKGNWSQNRRRWQNIPAKKKPSKMEEAPRMAEETRRVITEPLYEDDSSSVCFPSSQAPRMAEGPKRITTAPLYEDYSSSESELYICLDV